MSLERIYVCTSKSSRLYRIYLLQTGDNEKDIIYNTFRNDLQQKMATEHEMQILNGNALIEDIPYYIDFDEILEESYLYNFKSEIEKCM
ncbi:hypothetical protein EOQ13_11085, partial [Staphylococcus pseudintermedius]|nr:hypothetical protein [Staphylococcus pseudintermedius]